MAPVAAKKKKGALRGLDDGLEPREMVLHGRRLDADVADVITEARLSRTIDGASTVTLSLFDGDRKLLRRNLFTRRVRLNLDDLVFETVALSKTGAMLEVTFEDADVAELRRLTGPLVIKPGTMSRTRAARRLVQKVRGLRFKGEPGEAVKVALAVGGKDNPKEDYWTALQRWAAERQWRCFCDEGTVYFGSDAWLIEELGPPFELSEEDEGIDSIDFTYDSGQRAAEANIACRMRRWAAAPGAPVKLLELGNLAGGTWLATTLERSLFSPQGFVVLTRKTAALPEPEPPPPPASYQDTPGQSGQAGGGSVGTGVPSASGWVWPMRGPITGQFGEDRGTHRHGGIDIAGPLGTPVVAAKAGTVTHAYTSSSYGNVVYISHGGGFESRYAHLQSMAVRAGQSVGAGDMVGRCDSTGRSTGNHLHFEIRINGAATDPLRYLP